MTSKVERKIEELETVMVDAVEDEQITAEEKSILREGLTNLQKTRVLLKKRKSKKRSISPDEPFGIFVRIGDGNKNALTAEEIQRIFGNEVIDQITIGKGGMTAIIKYQYQNSAERCLKDYEFYWQKYGLKVEKQKYKK